MTGEDMILDLFGDDDDDDDGFGASEKKSVATQLVELAEKRYTLGVSTAGLPFAIAIDGPNIARPLRGGRLGLRAALADAFMWETGRAASSGALADALLVIEGRCAQAEPTPLYQRVAPFDGGIILDLGTPDGRAVNVDAKGWRILTRSPVTFRRSELTLPLPEPQRVNADLLDQPIGNVSPASWPLVQAWLVAALIHGIPHPVLLLRGEHGTGKTTLAAELAPLIDPSGAPVRSAPRDLEQWSVTALGSWIIALDNLSSVPQWLSDSICRAVTGDGAIKRKLYTDDDVSVISFRRAVIITSIDPGSLRGDLADRLLPIDLDRIAPSDRRTDEDLALGQEAQHPALLGALLDLTSEVLAELPQVWLAEMPRMADFAKILAALDRLRPCVGQTRLDLFRGLHRDMAREVVEGDPFANAVKDFAKARGTWRGTATQLGAAVSMPDPRPRGWPTSPRGIGGALRRIAPSLLSVGIEVDYGQTSGTGSQRIFILRDLDGHDES